MSDAERARVGRKAAAFDRLMRNLGTESDPFRGNPDEVDEALEILAEPVPEPDSNSGSK
ncbi:hypothetical protein [Actinomadura rugatobispora]|uniref:Uncharacterized protein n=1 Tax=Actinomadura rugatobispora TaxID=1994 RepID=A0ABW1A290_9ACTN|nr:hypothetical protein GCM10010200_012010 [Actinomadura rugatobispora]